MRLVCISDTHGLHRQLRDIPDGDVLIHAGDFLGVGKLDELEDFNEWLGGLPHRHKIIIAGNHDWAIQDHPEAARLLITEAVYLEDEGVEVESIRFWGSPWTPYFRNWAFNLKRGEPLARRWAKIPDNTDVLITHGPPRGILDEAHVNFRVERAGCQDLADRVEQLRVKAHIFGHIHEGYGQTDQNGVRYVNASTCTIRYRPDNPPITLDVSV